MRPGSVIVDLAAERGGNCELTRARRDVRTVNGVKIVGASQCRRDGWRRPHPPLRANLLAFVETLIDKETKKLAINWDDELVKATCLTRDGAVIAPAISTQSPA